MDKKIYRRQLKNGGACVRDDPVERWSEQRFEHHSAGTCGRDAPSRHRCGKEVIDGREQPLREEGKSGKSNGGV